MITRESLLRRKEDLVASNMDGELVMLDIETGKYFGLSGVAPHVWDILADDRRAGAVVDSVLEHFATGPDQDVEGDILGFLKILIDKGLVRVVDQGA